MVFFYIKIQLKILPFISIKYWQNKTNSLTHIIKVYTQVFMGQIRRYENHCWQLS